MGLMKLSHLRAVAFVLILSALVTSVAVSTAVFAQGHDIEVVSQKVDSDFPNNISFRVQATSPDPIEEVRVFLKAAGSDRSTYGYVDIEPATEINGEYVMTLGTGPTHRPPGTIVRYSFEIRDSAGRTLRTEEQEFLYLDRSLEWKEISDGILTVYYYGDFVEKRARTVLEASKETMEIMGPVLGIQPTEPIRIVSYSNYRDMSRALPFRAQTVREDLRTEGQAWPSERVLLVLGSETTVTGIASHEFTHILVAEAAGRGYSRVPAWLNEGLAEYGNLDKTESYDYALAYAIFTRRLKPLWYLDSLVGEPDDIIIIYGHGRSVVRYLMEVYGDEKMTELMKAFRDGLSVDMALERAYGFNQYGLDSEWRVAVGLEPLPPPEELTSRLTPSPGPDSTPGEGASPSPTERPQATPPGATQHPAASDDGERRTSGGCGRSSASGASLPVDLAMMALLGVPLLFLPLRSGSWRQRLIRWRPWSRSGRRVGGG